MAAGDAQPTWFPEMVDELRKRWHADLSIADLIHLRDDLDSMLRRIRSERNIQTPIIRCRACGHVGHAADPYVSVRATIIAVRRFGLASAEAVRALEKHWIVHRQANGLNLEGKLATDPDSPAVPCSH